MMESFLQSTQVCGYYNMMWVHNVMFDNIPQVLQTLWLEICYTRETPSYPPQFQECRHSPEKDVKQSVNQQFNGSTSDPEEVGQP